MPIETDVVIIGAGPAGLFQVFELGLLGLKAHVIETLDHPGGQCSALYPDKPIYDIPALPSVSAQELTDRLLEQISPFDPTFHYSQQVTGLEKLADGRFLLTTSKRQQFMTRAVVIAAGMGAFQPVELKVEGIDSLVGDKIHYRVTEPERFRDKNIVVLGGGDSAFDWALQLQPIAQSIILIHRSTHFRAAPASVEKVNTLCDQLEMQFLPGSVTGVAHSDGKLDHIKVTGKDGVTRQVQVDELLVFFGLSPDLGPLADWGYGLHKNQISVDTQKFQTSIPGIYAIGDINSYPGKKKLILSGFHEAALAAFAIKEQLEPNKKVHLQYTTTSPIMHKRLGVETEPLDSAA